MTDDARRPGVARRPYRRRLAAILAAAGIVPIIVPWLTAGGAAQEALPVTMRLLDQTFTVGGGDMVSMSFAISGELPDEVLPTTTTSSTSTTTTSTTTTTRTAPRGSTDGGAGRPPTTRPSPTPEVTSTTSAARPEPTIVGDVRVVAYPAITSRSQVADALAGDISGEPIDGVLLPDLTAMLSTGPGARRDLRLDVEVPVPATDVSGEDDLELTAPGLYPVRVAIHIDGTAVASYTTLVRRIAAVPPPGQRLALVAGALDDSPLDDLQAMVELGASEPPLSVIIPPDALAEVETSRPRLVGRLAEALSGDESVSLATDEMDPSSAARADLDGEFIDALSAGEDALISLLPETPPRRTTWPLVEDVSIEGADLLSQLGARIFLTDTAYATGRIEPPAMPLPGQQIAVPIADDRNLGALVLDDDVARLLDDPPSGTTALQGALELLATLTLDEVAVGGRGVVLATDGFGVPDRAVVDELAELVAEAPDVDFVTLSSLPGYSVVDTSAQLTLPVEAGVDLTQRVEIVDQTRARLYDTSSMLPPDDPRPEAWAAALDDLLATNVDDDTATATIAELTAESDAIRGSIVPPDPFTFTLTGGESDVRLRVSNTSDTVLRVKVVPSSPKLTFPDGPQTIDVPPGAPTIVTIRVSARSNGTSSVAMSLRTPTEGELAPPVILTAKVNRLTGLSQVITGGALLVLATWWLHHFRQRRRERRGLPTRRSRPLSPAVATTEQVSPDAAEALVEVPPDAGDGRRAGGG